VSQTIADLQPSLIWKHFYGLTQVPRPSKKEEKVLAYLKQLIGDLGYPYEEDEVGNMVVRKPATAGYENAPSVVLQGHVDMVCEKNKGTEHDFDNDPLKVYIDGDWVTADGTTLGADNGIGVAAALAVLESKDLVHGPIEVLCTIDEETGLTGAKALKPGFLKSEIMLNLDSEEDGALYVGCSGGMDTAGVMSLESADAPAGYAAIEIMVSGLKGGHSGLDIHTGRGNAIKFLARIILELRAKGDVKLASISGGSKRNAIPREAECVICVPEAMKAAAIAHCEALNAVFLNEIGNVEPGLKITAQASTGGSKVITDAQLTTLIDVLYGLPHGVIKMSADIAGLVETSTNLATLAIEDGNLVIGTSQRSSVETEKQDIVNQVSAVFRLSGLTLKYGDGYPGWKPNMQSKVLAATKAAHLQLFGIEPEIKAIHAGLECGLIGEVFPKMDMISFGPTIMGAHSPDEKLEIKTVEKFWNLVTKVLENVARS
jgi:dipeptidase D